MVMHSVAFLCVVSYHQSYTEGSSIEGYWFEDYVSLDDHDELNPAVMTKLGCHTSENKLFYTQKANGRRGRVFTCA